MVSLRDSVEVDWVESNCIRQAEQFAVLHLCVPSITKKYGSAVRELPLAAG